MDTVKLKTYGSIGLISTFMLVSGLTFAKGPTPNFSLIDNGDGSVTATNTGKVSLVNVSASCRDDLISLSKGEATTICSNLTDGTFVTADAESSADSSKTVSRDVIVAIGGDGGGGDGGTGGGGGGEPVAAGCIGATDLTVTESVVTANFNVGAFWGAEIEPLWDSINDVRVTVDLPGLGGRTQLEVNVAGEPKYFRTAGNQLRELSFTDQLLRNYSIATIAVRDRSGSPITTSGWDASDFQLCGNFFDDTSFTARPPVNASVNLADIGRGVNLMGSEYACAQGWGVSHHTANGVSNQEIADMLEAWGVKTVRLPMNEHCWLAGLDGIDLGSDDSDNNGLFDYIETNNENDAGWIERLEGTSINNPDIAPVCSNGVCTTQGENYRASFKNLVDILTAKGMFLVLDLHWTGARGEAATSLKSLPNTTYSELFWTQIASLYKDQGNIAFNLFNEPHGITSWRVLRDGTGSYVGMQALADAVRDTGASNYIVTGGLDYSGDSSGWLSYAPYDPIGKLWSDNHAYPTGNKCIDDACWDRNLGPILDAGYGVMFGEAGNSIGGDPGGCEQADFLKKVYAWSINNDVPALTWTFIAGGIDHGQNSCPDDTDNNNSPSASSCNIPSMITRWPGQLASELVAKEVTDKCSYDPTPMDLHDDGTWAGCAALAYINGADVNVISQIDDVDPVTNNKYGNCSAQDWYSGLPGMQAQ